MSALQAITDLLDFRHAFLELFVHPVDTYQAYLPHLNVYELFGGNTYSPEKDIPDLSGTVILVTGGQSSLCSLGCNLLTCDLQAMQDLG